MRGIVAACVLVALSGCVETTEVNVRPAPISTTQLNLAKSGVVADFKDPMSAQFRGIRPYRVANGDTVVCGQVNGKNSLGGYVGFRPFYIRINGNTVRQSFYDFDDYGGGPAAIFCRDAASGAVSVPVSQV